MSLPIADLKRKATPGEVDCYRDSFNSKSSESKQKQIDDNKEVCKECELLGMGSWFYIHRFQGLELILTAIKIRSDMEFVVTFLIFVAECR